MVIPQSSPLRLELTDYGDRIQCRTYLHGQIANEQESKLDPATRLEWIGKSERSIVQLAQREKPLAKDLKQLNALGTTISQWLGPGTWEALRAYADCGLSLVLPISLCALPWELAIFDQQRINERYYVGRMVKESKGHAPNEEQLDEQPELVTEVPVQQCVQRMLIFANPGFDLLGAETEASCVKHRLDRRRDFVQTDITFQRMDPEQFLAAVAMVDWLHFAGHARAAAVRIKPERTEAGSVTGDESKLEQRVWTLGSQTLTSDQLRQVQHSVPQFIFANACGSAEIDSLHPADSLSLAWIEKGTTHFIGTRTKQPDRQARLLACEFYECIAAGQSIGKALSAATLKIFPSSPMCVYNYVLYGNPNQVLLPVPPNNSYFYFLDKLTGKSHGNRSD